MNPTDTVRYLLDVYPDLFIDEVDCLLDLFFTVGNDFTWEAGELTESDITDVALKEAGGLDELILGARLRHEKWLSTQKLHALGDWPWAHLLERYRQGPAAERARTAARREARGQTQYPRRVDLWRSSCIFNIPPDVTDAWLVAAKRCIALIDTGAVECAQNERAPLDDVRALIESLDSD